MEVEDEKDLVLSFNSKNLPCYFKKKITIKEKSCNITYSRFLKLQVTNYPIAKQKIDLSKSLLLKNSGKEMLYFKEKVAKGTVSYNFDRKQLPDLSFWNTHGDFNVALEMSNGYYASIKKAQRNNACPIIFPGSKMEFSLGFELIDF